MCGKTIVGQSLQVRKDACACPVAGKKRDLLAERLGVAGIAGNDDDWPCGFDGRFGDGECGGGAVELSPFDDGQIGGWQGRVE